MANFSGIFGAAVLLCAFVTFRSSEAYKKYLGRKVESADSGISEEVIKTHNNLLKRYIFVYLLATLADWLQGPFVYALYMDYGFKQIEIAQLFVAGFGSSMIFGSFVGGMADWGGRRNFVLIYAIVYTASCLTKRKLRWPFCYLPFRCVTIEYSLHFTQRFQQLWNSDARKASWWSFDIALVQRL